MYTPLGWPRKSSLAGRGISSGFAGAVVEFTGGLGVRKAGASIAAGFARSARAHSPNSSSPRRRPGPSFRLDSGCRAHGRSWAPAFAGVTISRRFRAWSQARELARRPCYPRGSPHDPVSTMRPRLLPLLLALCTLAPAAHAAKPLEVRDLATFERVSSPALSPDGRKLVFAVRQVDFAANKATTSLWI